MRLIYVYMQHSYVDMHVTCIIFFSKIIFFLRVNFLTNIIMLHVGILYLACRGQKYATILKISFCRYNIPLRWLGQVVKRLHACGRPGFDSSCRPTLFGKTGSDSSTVKRSAIDVSVAGFRRRHIKMMSRITVSVAR